MSSHRPLRPRSCTSQLFARPRFWSIGARKQESEKRYARFDLRMLLTTACERTGAWRVSSTNTTASNALSCTLTTVGKFNTLFVYVRGTHSQERQPKLHLLRRWVSSSFFGRAPGDCQPRPQGRGATSRTQHA